MDVGYMRVSRQDQDPGMQRRALEEAECGRIYEEKISGASEERPQLAAAMDYCREGDTLVVWKLDRFGRSLKDLLAKMEILRAKGVGFRSLTEQLDTTTPGGRLVFHIFGSLAEFERDLIRERTHAGLEAARARGRKGGRKPVMDEKKLALASKLMRNRDTTVSEVCEAVGISRATLYRYLKPDGSRREAS